MTFELRWSAQAINDLAGLDPGVAVRITRKLEQTRTDPLRSFLKLRGREGWRLRVGDFRVVAAIDLRRRVIVVAALGHRRNVYDR